MSTITRRGTLAAATGLAAFGLVPGARANQLDAILRAGRIRIATDLAIPPFGMVDSQMRPTGSDVDVAQALARDLGVQMEFVQTVGATRIPNLQTHKADIIISTLSVTPERARVIQFSKPYAALASVIGGRRDVAVSSLQTLRGRTVATVRGTTQDTELTPIANEHGFRINRYDDDATLITAAVSGQAELVATSATSVGQIALRAPARGFEVKFTLRNFDLAIGLRQGETQLLERVNAWIDANIANGRLNEIYKRFHGVDLPEAMRGRPA